MTPSRVDRRLMFAPSPTPLARLAMSRVGNYLIVARSMREAAVALDRLLVAVRRDGGDLAGTVAGTVAGRQHGRALLDNGSTVDAVSAGMNMRGRLIDGVWFYNLDDDGLDELVAETQRSLRIAASSPKRARTAPAPRWGTPYSWEQGWQQ